jgi:hypothetical protein
MGIEFNAAAFLARSRSAGVSFARTASIGRQSLTITHTQVGRAFAWAGLPLDDRDARALSTFDGWAEPLFTRLGAETVESIDVSSFEGATIIHDLNERIPASLESRFSAVVDAGTLEHVFDFPTAIENCMRMVEPGGHLIAVSPVNNEAGHGFYQFSPELFFRVMAPANGFVVDEMLMLEPGRRGAQWYRVADPAVAGQRAQFRSRTATYMFVRARRISEVPDRLVTPQQSDYETAWEHGGYRPFASPRSLVSAARRRLPEQQKDRLRAIVESLPLYPTRSQRAFRRHGYSRLNRQFTRIEPPRR